MNQNNLNCKIFIDTDESYEYMYKTIAEIVRGKIENRNTIRNEILDLSLLNNDDFEVTKRHCFPDYLEVEPCVISDPISYVTSISMLLELLWRDGFKVVAACDFEEQLPRKGGYNYRY
ncbi:MAG: 1,4-dihydroxy-6-naphthoate synthase [Paenibacillus sp.]|jgi:hypothetical protein|nr:1,4-dihydroxy-6-naphthoate synthase [Paenibacillus sp.]